MFPLNPPLPATTVNDLSSHSVCSLEQSTILIDPAILIDEDPLKASELHQATYESESIDPSAQGTVYPYPDTPDLLLDVRHVPDHWSSRERSVDRDSLTYLHTLINLGT